jgi:para-aminobenzoate synthetase component 2
MKFSMELEPTRRGPYYGSLDWIDYSGDMAFNILIRTMVVRGGCVHFQAGGGIVIDSDPEREYKESPNKAKALWKAVQDVEREAEDAYSHAAGGREAREGGTAMILVIDNYDSFTYNLVQYLGELGEEIVVRRNDEIDLAGIEALAPDHILISPGPCTPNEAGISLALIDHFKGKIPIFGVCLGHQAIGQAFGGEVVRAENLMHGKTSEIHHTGKGVFAGLPSPFTATRYHSLIVKRETLPDCLEITAETETGEIMGIKHKEYLVEGVQFHPESIMTEHGRTMLRNFLAYKAGAVR